MTGEARGKAIEPLSQRFLHGIVADLAVGDEGRVSGADGQGHESGLGLESVRGSPMWRTCNTCGALVVTRRPSIRLLSIPPLTFLTVVRNCTISAVIRPATGAKHCPTIPKSRGCYAIGGPSLRMPPRA